MKTILQYKKWMACLTVVVLSLVVSIILFTQPVRAEDQIPPADHLSLDSQILPVDKGALSAKGAEVPSQPENIAGAPKESEPESVHPVTSFADLKTALEKEGEADVLLGADITFDAPIHMTGNGVKRLKNAPSTSVRLTGSEAFYQQEDSFIRLSDGANLIIEGGAERGLTFDGQHKAVNLDRGEGYFITVESGSQLILNGSQFSGASSLSNNTLCAPIVVKGADSYIEVNDSIISDNQFKGNDWGSAPQYVAGGIYLYDNAQGKMTSGEITGNSAGTLPHPGHPLFRGQWATYGSGGALLLEDGAQFTLEGGQIHNNIGTAGGVFVGTGDPYQYDRTETDPNKLKQLRLASFTMTGGEIFNNVGASSGTGAGGVIAFGAGEFTMTGGQIYQNVGYQGGGVIAYDYYVSSEADGTGFIHKPANVSIEDWSNLYPGRFVFDGGEIYKNISFTNGGGVEVASNQTVFLKGVIRDNFAPRWGGGVYVACVPYLLLVPNTTYLDKNSAGSAAGMKADMGNGGGALWFCPTGDAIFHVENGVIIEENTGYKAGDSFMAEKKYAGHYTVHLPERSPLGYSMPWYQDGAEGRYQPGDLPLKGPFVYVDEALSLKTLMPDAFRNTGQKFSALIVTGNHAGLAGGGFASNGSITFGHPPSEEHPLLDISVEKVFPDLDKTVYPENIQISVFVNLDNDKKLVDQITLNRANDYQVVLKNLPATINGQSTLDLLSFKEVFVSGEKQWIFKQLPAKKVGEVTKELTPSAADPKKPLILYHQAYTITLENRKKEPPKPPSGGDNPIIIRGQKIWRNIDSSDQLPPAITLALYRNGKQIDSQEIKADEDGNWRYAFAGLAKKDFKGKDYHYEVKEVPVVGYQVSYDGTTIINTRVPEEPPEKPSEPPVTPPDKPGNPPDKPENPPDKPEDSPKLPHQPKVPSLTSEKPIPKTGLAYPVELPVFCLLAGLLLRRKNER